MDPTRIIKKTKMKNITSIITAIILALVLGGCSGNKKIKSLIITGQSEHNWEASSPVLKDILEKSALFDADVLVSPPKGEDMSGFNPDFSAYSLVVLDYSGDQWNEATQKAFEEFVRNGGGVVVYHGASISFPDWKEYNLITGVGGWNGRNEKNGPYVYYAGGREVRDTAAGPAGGHGERREFEVRTRVTDHPVTQGLPARWMHGSDELYQNLRGPAENMTVLATAFADPKMGGSGREEPVLMVIEYGNGRVFHTTLGHADEGGGPAMECTGFIETFLRGAEWAATGTVTRMIPSDFPTASGVVLRPGFIETTLDEAFEKIGSYDTGKSTRYFTFISNEIRKAAGDTEKLASIEKKLVKVLIDDQSTVEARRLILKELSWMGSSVTLDALKAIPDAQDLNDDIEFVRQRLN